MQDFPHTIDISSILLLHLVLSLDSQHSGSNKIFIIKQNTGNSLTEGAYLAVISVPQTKWNNAVIHSCIKIKPTHLAAINSVLRSYKYQHFVQ